MSLDTSTLCPALEAAEEWKEAATALDELARASTAAIDAGPCERFARAFDRLHELAGDERGPVSHAGAVAALELVTEHEAMDLDDCRALAALALRYLRLSRPTT
jgi:hypothetical protein